MPRRSSKTIEAGKEFLALSRENRQLRRRVERLKDELAKAPGVRWREAAAARDRARAQNKVLRSENRALQATATERRFRALECELATVKAERDASTHLAQLRGKLLTKSTRDRNYLGTAAAVAMDRLQRAMDFINDLEAELTPGDWRRLDRIWVGSPGSAPRPTSEIIASFERAKLIN